MAKTAVKRGNFSFSNVQKLTEEQQETPVQAPKTQKYSISFEASLSNIEWFEKQHIEFLYQTQNMHFKEKKNFFRLLVHLYQEYLKGEEKLLKSPQEALLKNKGRKAKENTNEKKAILFGVYQDDTKQKFDDVCYSMMVKNHWKDLHQYNRDYFFNLLLSHYQEHRKEIVKTFKQKGLIN